MRRPQQLIPFDMHCGIVRLWTYVLVYTGFFSRHANGFQAKRVLYVHSPDISIAIDEVSGGLVSANASTGWKVDLQGSTTWVSSKNKTYNLLLSHVYRCGANKVCVLRNISAPGETSSGHCCQERIVELFDRYEGMPASGIRWTTEASSNSTEFWRTSTFRSLRTAGGTSRWWAASSGKLKTGAIDTAENVLRLRTGSMSCSYGGNAYWKGWGSEQTLDEICPIPLSLHAVDEAGAGLGHMLALNDTILAAQADGEAHAILWEKRFDRMGKAKKIKTTSYLFFSPNGWRSTLKWSHQAFPSYFEATVSSMPNLGLGAYSCANAKDMNLTWSRDTVGFNTVWDAHFWWPYQGMFFPPDTSIWKSNLGRNEKTGCGSHFVHGQQVSLESIVSEYKDATERGLVMLAYFNFNFFGQNVELNQAVQNPHSKADNAWKNSSLFLQEHFLNATMEGPVYDWQRSVLMDPTQQVWFDWLLEQVNATVGTLGDYFQGIVVDEPHLAEFNLRGDDGISWCGQTCSSLSVGWLEVARQIRRLLPSNSIMLSNQIRTLRMDTLKYFDGIFSETLDASVPHECSINAIGLMTSGSMPAIVWTMNEGQLVTDTFMQHHLLMGVSPMAPVLGNDHALLPTNEKVNLLYAEYGNIFRELRGSRWYLNGALHTLPTSGIAINAFEAGSKFVIVVTALLDSSHMGLDDSLTVYVEPPPKMYDPKRCVVVRLSNETASIIPRANNQRWEFQTVLHRGFVMLKCLAVKKEQRSTLSIVTVTNETIQTLGQDFVSFTLDSAFFCDTLGFSKFAKDKNVRWRSSLLSPMTLRVGGTQQDMCQAAFGPYIEPLPGVPKQYGCNVTMSKLQALNDFVSGLPETDLVYGLNALTRDVGVNHSSWDDKNAKEIVQSEIMEKAKFELGNEPALWQSNKWTQTTAQQHAEDYEKLRALTANHYQSVVGPDWFIQCLPTYPQCDTTYLKKFLSAGPSLDVVTYHSYPWLGTIVQPVSPVASDLYNETLLNIEGIAASSVVQAVRKTLGRNVPVWMGEGSPDWKLQSGSLGNNFTFEFAFIDMLGQMASSGVSKALRQTLRGVLGPTNELKFNQAPPAFFAMVLWKRLFSGNVHRTIVTKRNGSGIRAYAHGKTVLLLNVNAQEEEVQLNLPSEFCHGETIQHEYHCTPGQAVTNFVSGFQVNGEQAEIRENRDIVFKPKVSSCGSTVRVAGKSFVFVESLGREI